MVLTPAYILEFCAVATQISVFFLFNIAISYVISARFPNIYPGGLNSAIWDLEKILNAK